MVKKSDTYYEILGQQRNRPKGMDVFNDESHELVPSTGRGDNGLNGVDGSSGANEVNGRLNVDGQNVGQAKDGAGMARQLTPVDSSLTGVPEKAIRTLNVEHGTLNVNGSDGSKGVNGSSGVDGGLNVDRSSGVNGSSGVDRQKGVNGVDGSSGQNGVDGSHPLGRINRILGADPLGSAEEQARRRKREKRERLFSAIGDGISALSNLYYTTRYAPNAYNGQNSQSKVVGDRWDRLNKERAANHKAWVDAAISMEQNDTLNRIRQQNADANQAYRERESQRKADEAEVKKKAQEIKNAKEQAYTDWVNERAKGQGAMDEAKIEYYKTKIDCLNRGMSLKEAESKAKIAELDSRTKLNNRRGTSSWVGGSGGSGKGGSGKGKYYGTFLGKSYQTKADYDKAVTDYAKNNGIATTEISGGYGNRHIGGHIVNRPISTIAAEGERHNASSRPKPQAKPKAKGKGGKGGNKATKNKHVQALGW